jgi:signal transduction histidine kinase/CheY-like chemotaxis protein
VDGTHIAFAVLDADGTIVAVDRYWREAAREGAPFGPGFQVGECYPDLCDSWPRPQAPALRAAVRSVLAGECHEGRVAYDHPCDGEMRRSEVRITRFDLQGQRHAMVLHVDLQSAGETILERLRQAKTSVEHQTADLARHAEDLVRARARAVQLMRGRADFMANLSHEIRTPMNGIIGMTDLALDTDLTDEQREYLAAVRSSADSLLTLLNNILDFSSVESGQLLLAKAAFSLRDVLTGALEPMLVRAREKGLELVHELDSGVPDLLIGDPARLGQILHNLIDNAIKFTARGRITVRVVPLRITGREMAVRFDVVDTGVGIDPSRHDRIFECFAQADGSSTRRHGGTGLGLTIASQLVTWMGGRLQVESRPARGSTFSFAITFRLGRRPGLRPLPRFDETLASVGSDGSEPDSRPATRTRRERLRVLVAEDNPVDQRVVRSALERRGHLVELVENGRHAVHRAASEHFDLVLVDIEMPVLDGFGATALIREHEKGTDSHVPIVAVIDQSTQPDRERFRRAGMDDVLPKPIDPETLGALLQRCRAESEADSDAASASARAVLPPLDNDRLFEQTGGDLEALAELAALFMQERDTILQPIVQAIESCDPGQLEQAAHKLKGTFGSLAAPRATAAVCRLERMGRVGNPDAVQSALTALRAEVGLLEDELRSLADDRAEG